MRQRDVATAAAIAKAQGKRVIVDVGGQWCSWCHILDRFIAAQCRRPLRCATAGYVWVKVNWSKENRTRRCYRAGRGSMAIRISSCSTRDGKLLHSQDTGLLESGTGYDKAKFIAFLRAWAPVRAS